jgi:hypothetical protein
MAISWNVCTPLSDALKYDIYNREMDSMTMEDFDELVFERTPKGYVTLIIDLGGVRKDCQLQTAERTSWTAGCFLSRAFGRRDIENTRNILQSTTIRWDVYVANSNGISTTPVILTDGSNSVGLFEKTNTSTMSTSGNQMCSRFSLHCKRAMHSDLNRRMIS